MVAKVHEEVDVAVIGAGIAGIGALKEFSTKGFKTTCFETEDHVGGLWQFKEKGYGVMSFTHINVSKYNYCFSDYPMPESYPDFIHHSQMAEYVNSYVDHFDIRKNIKFRHRVEHVKKVDDLYHIEVLDLETQETKVYKAQYLAICSGHHQAPIHVKFPGQDTFKGEIIHSVDFNNSEDSGLKGKEVLIVGIGNSAVDIAANAAGYAKHVTISTRSGSWVFPNYILGCPVDLYMNRIITTLGWRLVAPVLETLLSVLYGHPDTYNLNPNHHLLQTQPTVSPTLFHTIQRGYVDVVPNIKRFDGNFVEFTDGKRRHFDKVIMCTGYKISLPYLEESLKANIMDEESNKISLYKHVFSPFIGPSLAFIGFVQPSTGGLLPIMEIQARWFAQICVGKLKLPKNHEMMNDIKRYQKEVRSRFVDRPRHTIQEDTIRYCDEIASKFGAKPSFWRNPSLWLNLVLGSGGAYQWRLNGPDSSRKAAALVRKTPVGRMYLMLVKILSIPMMTSAILLAAFLLWRHFKN